MYERKNEKIEEKTTQDKKTQEHFEKSRKNSEDEKRKQKKKISKVVNVNEMNEDRRRRRTNAKAWTKKLHSKNKIYCISSIKLR